MGRRWRKAALGCSAIVLAVAVVIPAGSGIAAETRTSAVPAKLVAVWSRNVTKANWKKYGVTPQQPGESGGDPAGVWTMVVKKSGSIIPFYSPNGYFANCKTCLPDFTERFSIAGARLTLAPLGGNCPGKGLYRWNVSGSALTLTVIADKCREREALLTGIWQRK